VASLSKPTMYVIGWALLLPILGIARAPYGDAVSEQAVPSSQGWTCQWLDDPIISPGAVGNQCQGVVHCRHHSMQTLVPQVRQVTCSVRGRRVRPFQLLHANESHAVGSPRFRCEKCR